MSISAGILVIAVVLIRSIGLNRLPKLSFLVLWGVTLFRLLVPVAIPARFSFYSIFRGIVNSLFQNHSAEIASGNGLSGNEMGILFLRVEEAVGGQASIIPWATVVWIAGIASLLIFFSAVYYKSHRDLRFATVINDNEFLSKWIAKHRLRRPIAIMQSDKITTPLAVGIIKPRIILPKGIDMSDTQLLSHVLIHEFHHIKRFDALWKLLLVFAVCIHWFNPLVWVMFILANRDMELICDEMVINHFGAEKKTAYAYSLIGMAEQRKKFTSLLNSGFSKNAAEERIESIMKKSKKSIVSIIVAVVVVVVLAIGTMSAFAINNSPSDVVESNRIERVIKPDATTVNNLRSLQNIANGYGILATLDDYEENSAAFDEITRIIKRAFGVEDAETSIIRNPDGTYVRGVLLDVTNVASLDLDSLWEELSAFGELGFDEKGQLIGIRIHR